MFALYESARAFISGDLSDRRAAGIYASEFTDDIRHAGKASDVHKRHAERMRGYHHEAGSRRRR